MDWVWFVKVMQGTVAVWAKTDDFAYRNYLIPRIVGVALAGGIIGFAAASKNGFVTILGGSLLLIFHDAIYVMVIRDSNQPD